MKTKMKHVKPIYKTVKLSEYEKNALTMLCEINYRNASEMIRELIRDEAERKNITVGLEKEHKCTQ